MRTLTLPAALAAVLALAGPSAGQKPSETVPLPVAGEGLTEARVVELIDQALMRAIDRLSPPDLNRPSPAPVPSPYPNPNPAPNPAPYPTPQAYGSPQGGPAWSAVGPRVRVWLPQGPILRSFAGLGAILAKWSAPRTRDYLLAPQPLLDYPAYPATYATPQR